MHAISRRAVAAVAGATIALTVGGIGTASANGGGHNGGNNGGGHSDCGPLGITYKVDGGRWTTEGRINGDTPPSKITVKLTSTPDTNCSYTVSLASYSAEGPAWENSGHQDFLGWDSVTLDRKHKSATLDVSAHAPDCFGQVDLYGNGTQYDGGTGPGHGPLPHYNDSPTPTNLITAWNGGHECQTSPSPTPSQDSPSPTPSEDSPSPTPTTESPSATPTTDSPSPTQSTGAPAPSVSDTAAPTGTPSVPPATSPATGTGNLAETGSNSNQNTALIAGAAALLVAGGAAVYFTRRRRTGNHS
ncbi:LAETG motif-containing sortase-dependent surface protein [Streptomyces sp. NPDC021020]|uniref:LAETG motif-containing sortase-dependent surface protein n=1 Tax=Streptomyces sp. NPDC021020 TaxID=3365109 RepID=UPI0037BCDD54